ncbi:MAG TPA: ribosome biogenesis GTPase Der [Candidatus Brocadiia bacterium]|nr:ribosome biogenesis GTPase Der [Candidatus Brocadiia bacterium]
MGKSSLFNCVVGRRIAIVDDMPGVTRDRLSSEAERNGLRFNVTDTGGVGIVDRDDLSEEVEKQITMACEEADVIILAVDARDGLNPYDEEIARRLRTLGKPCIVAVNKIDHPGLEIEKEQFHKLGFNDVFPVSAVSKQGIGEMLDRAAELLPAQAGETAPAGEDALKIAIVGKRNSGKSTYANALAGRERVIVSEVPGTTRDSVDIRIRRGEREIILIDTAGMRKKRQVKDPVEYYSVHRAQRSIRRCDVVIHVMEAPADISQVDKDIGAYIIEEFKPFVLVLNKIDLTAGVKRAKFIQYVRQQLQGAAFAPICFMSAMKGTGIDDPLKAAFRLHEQASYRAPTAALNQALHDALQARSPAATGRAFPKLYYATQVETNPPTFVLFVNKPELFSTDYRRYLANHIRKNLPFPEVPVKILMRRHTSRNGGRESK